MRVTLLGTGTSHGVPAIGCDCLVCHSDDPRDRRTRPSILIELGDGTGAPDGGVGNILVDTATDLRAQALTYHIRRVDAILFTHSHADHVLGLDEVRRYNALQKSAIGCYGDAQTLADLRRMFAYIFAPTSVSPVASTTTSKPSACATCNPSSTTVNLPAWIASSKACGLSAVPTSTSPYAVL